jgi:hypothetical protein
MDTDLLTKRKSYIEEKYLQMNFELSRKEWFVGKQTKQKTFVNVK